ncbi:MAG: hypothetical protein ACP5OG_04340 [Candidatus Nanoarchaeia archaeon]
MTNIIRRYITKSGTIYDHFAVFPKTQEENVLIKRSNDKAYKIIDWNYVSKEALEKYNGNPIDEKIGRELLKNKTNSKLGGRIIFKDSKGNFLLTTAVEHIREPTGIPDFSSELEEKAKDDSTIVAAKSQD